VPPPTLDTVAVFVGGAPVDTATVDTATVDPALRAHLDSADVVIAADSGLYAARRLGLRVDVLVGDLDSVDPADIADPSFEVERHPRAKDKTDIALALDRARDLRPRRLIVVSGGGGRLDHEFGNLLVLASPAYAEMEIDAFIGDARVFVIRSRRDLTGPEGRLISLFAVDGPALGVTTTGLRFPLHEDVLEPLSSHGVSNEFLGGPASVSLTAGTVLAIQPGEEPEDQPDDEPEDQPAEEPEETST
jgi:thiamine pyrophosphokinase